MRNSVLTLNLAGDLGAKFSRFGFAASRANQFYRYVDPQRGYCCR